MAPSAPPGATMAPWTAAASAAVAAAAAMLSAAAVADAAGAAAAAGVELPSLVWMSPVLAGGGYSSEAIAYALGLDPAYNGGDASSSSAFGLVEFAEHENVDFVRGLPDASKDVLQRAFGAGARRRSWDVAVCHATPDVWHSDGAFGWGSVAPCPPPGAGFSVGRTMYETDRLPEAWVARIERMDEVWVPSAFAVEQFAASGVSRSKLVVVPEAVDTHLFDPAQHKPLDVAQKTGTRPGDFVFLSVFKWERRKGWDVLLKAYFEEFSADDPVMLYVKTRPFHSDSNFAAHIASLAGKLENARQPLARYAVLAEDLPLRSLPRLYRAADAFVLPSRGEGWGRPHVEAMAMALPVIATNWSGSTEFLTDDNSLPLPIDGLSDVVDGPAGHRWAEPSVSELRRLMRWAAEHREDAAAVGARAREDMVLRFSPDVVVRTHVLPRLRAIAAELDGRGGRRARRRSGRGRRGAGAGAGDEL
eukprot:TRINITY_DN25522_c0_g1_i2.p1 TRINITY_DN25522_c0_g1~~TRINITY_DN25522_c0_g1_i2.p1  ORF type:complete len:475 (-),score=99.38 TRINITY_DN25522_c0_g1_i2:39-1463(-)